MTEYYYRIFWGKGVISRKHKPLTKEEYDKLPIEKQQNYSQVACDDKKLQAYRKFINAQIALATKSTTDKEGE